MDLPVGEINPVMRLHQVSFAMRGHKESGQAVGADAIVQMSGFAPPTIHSLGARVASSFTRRLFNLVVTNVPGPQFPLYAAGARGSFDVAAVHPFSARVSNVVKLARLARLEMRKAGDARKPLLLTELSWSSGKGKSTFNYGWETTEAGQAEKIRQVLPALAAERKRLGLAGLYWYTWLSRPVGGRDSFDYGGLRRVGGEGRSVDKPALRAWRDTISRLTR